MVSDTDDGSPDAQPKEPVAPGELAHLMAHDLRTPLEVAFGRLELARSTGEREHLAAVLAALERMDELIDDLAALGAAADSVDSPEPVDLAAVAHASWDLLAPTEARLTVDADGPVLANRSRLRQLLANLLQNAVEHAGPAVHVRVGLTADGTVLFVSDDGDGIPRQINGHALEPGVSTAPNGTGYGLVVVQRMAAAHGWTLALTESATGGTRVELHGIEQPEPSP